jgi:hypothetical protein
MLLPEHNTIGMVPALQTHWQTHCCCFQEGTRKNESCQLLEDALEAAAIWTTSGDGLRVPAVISEAFRGYLVAIKRCSFQQETPITRTLVY